MNGRREAVISVRVRGPSGPDVLVSAIIDTGFTGLMTLPATTVGTLGLPQRSSRPVKLGDGSLRQITLYAAEVEWDGRWLPILVHQAGREVLVGTQLLNGFRTAIGWVPGGAVEIHVI